jgi:hypothetical protein
MMKTREIAKNRRIPPPEQSHVCLARKRFGAYIIAGSNRAI